MKTSGQLEWTDYLKAQYLHMRPSSLLGTLPYVLLGFLVLVGVVGVISALAVGLLPETWPLVILFLLLVVAIPLYYYVFLPRRLRGLFAQHKELGAPVEHEITPEGLVTTSQYGNANRPWDIFRKWKESKDLLMLYITDLQFVMLPKRFCTAEQLAAVHTYLDQHKVLEASKVKSPGSWARTAIWVLLVVVLAVVFYIGFHSPTP